MAAKVRSVIVTGAAQGIGEGVARKLREEGYELFLADVQEAQVARVASDLGVASGFVDIADPGAARRMVQGAQSAIGPIDALVNVAGIDAPNRDAPQVDEEHWRTLIDVDLSGPWWCITAALPGFIERSAGRIVNIASVCGVVPCPGVSVAYAAAKAGLVGLTMALAQQVEGRGVLVNAIAPGATGNTGTSDEQTEADRALYHRVFPLGFGGREPTAHAVSYLLGPAGSWVSGAVMNVTGGYWRGR